MHKKDVLVVSVETPVSEDENPRGGVTHKAEVFENGSGIALRSLFRSLNTASSDLLGDSGGFASGCGRYSRHGGLQRTRKVSLDLDLKRFEDQNNVTFVF